MEHQFDIFIIRIIACIIMWHMDSGLFQMPSIKDHARN
jgi:hypothetical protein